MKSGTDNWTDLNTCQERKRPLLNFVPGSCSHSGATAVKGHMRGVGSEPCQDAVWITVRKRVDLHRVVGARRHQLPILWMKGSSVPGIDLLNCHQTFSFHFTHLQGEGVHLFSHSDELWIVVIKTLPYPDISIITAGYKEPANIKCSQKTMHLFHLQFYCCCFSLKLL